MNKNSLRLSGRALGAAVLASGVLLATAGITVRADGSESLGAPSIAIASGTDVDVAGTGLWTQPGIISIDVPGANTVEQVLVYWEGHQSSATTGGDDTIELNGTSVTGQLIGGPTLFWDGHWSATYRADVTALGLVGPGANSVSVSGLSFDETSNGAGLLVISDDGTTAHDIIVRDGNDLAFIGFSAPLDTTVVQTYTFDPAPVARTVELKIFASSVEDSDLPGERPNVIEVIVDGVSTRHQHLLGSNDGDEWDTAEIVIDVPAGVGSLTVQALSADDQASGNLPASLAWLASTLVVPPYVEPTTTTTPQPNPTPPPTDPTTTTTTPQPNPTPPPTDPTTTTVVGQGGPTSTTTTTTVASGAVTPTTIATELPATGSDDNRMMVAIGIGLTALGLTLLLGSRRPQNI